MLNRNIKRGREKTLASRRFLSEDVVENGNDVVVDDGDLFCL